MTRADFTEIIAGLCEAHGGSVTSWIRSRKHNAKVGGKPASRHQTGFGIDVVLDADEDGNPANDELAILAFVQAADALGIRAIDEGDHIHCQPIGPWGRVQP